jgi:hypothetical protein
MVFVEAFGEVLRSRTDLDQVVTPRPSQRHRRLAEQQLDVDRQVRLSGAAGAGIRNEPHDRRIALRQRPLLRDVGRRGRDERERRHGDERETR